jgi:glycosyltransferase involved in cell wall biosynthesis
MRITFVLPDLNFSGGNRVVAIYARRLESRGHDVHVISGCERTPNLFQQIKSLVKGKGWTSSIGAKQPYFEELGISVQTVSPGRPITDVDAPDADVVIATWWETAEWVSKLGSKKGVKAHLIQHHEIFEYLPIERCRAAYRLRLKRIVISKWLQDLMASEYDDHSCVLIPNSVDTEQFFAPVRDRQQRPTIGFLYSTVPFKGPDILLRTLHEVKSRLPEIRAIAFGAEKISSSFPLPKWVEFHYRPKQEEIRFFYSKCDVWLCASRSEGFHLPPLEAMACRCPVVSTRVGGPLDTIQDGLNGFLVNVGDVDGLVSKLLDVLALDNESWKAMASAAEETARSYTWDDAAERFESALQSFVSSKVIDQLASMIVAAN